MRYADIRRSYPQIDSYLEYVADQPRTKTAQAAALTMIEVRIAQEVKLHHQNAVLRKVRQFSRLITRLADLSIYTEPLQCRICGSIENNGEMCRWCGQNVSG